MKKNFFGVLALIVGFMLVFALAGCGDNGDPSSPPGGGGTGGATAVPNELQNTKWYRQSESTATFFFTTDKLGIGDPGVIYANLLVKVTGTKIEYATEAFASAGMWQLFCDSYVLSGDTLTISGGSGPGAYKQSAW